MTLKKTSSTLAFAVLVSLSLPLQALPESAEISAELLDEHFKQGDYEFVI